MRYWPSGALKEIAQAEKLREQGELTRAFELLDPIIETCQGLIEGREESDHVAMLRQLLASALGHRIVCYQHLWQNTGNWDYLEWAHEDAALGQRLQVPPDVRAVFYHRMAHILLDSGDRKGANEQARYACTMVKPGGHQEAEFLGMLASTQTALGTPLVALETLERALRLVEKDAELRPFHRFVIVSGLLAKMADAAVADRRPIEAVTAFASGYLIALRLALQFRMSQRLKQYHRALWQKIWGSK